MTERILGPWTKEEDRLLIQAVEQYGSDNWKAVAALVPGRTNKACRKRWLHSLSPTLKKTAWTYDEDRLLIHLHSIHGPKWSTIARYIDGRTDDACSKRYRESLDPNLRKHAWSAEEDAKLSQIVAEKGGKWKDIGQELQRGTLDCRNRWRLIERKLRSKGSVPVLHTNFQVEPANYSFNSAPEFSIPYIWEQPLYPERDVTFSFSSSSLCNALSEQHLTRAREPHIAMNSGSDSSPESLPLSLPNDFTSAPQSNSRFPVQYTGTQYEPAFDPILALPSHQITESVMDGSTQESLPSSSQLSVIPLIEDSFLQEVHPSSDISECINEAPVYHSQDSSPYDDLSSAVSSPFQQTSSLSPRQSPSCISPIELPATDNTPLLFSSNTFQGQGTFSIRPMKKKRLSSRTALPDESIQPYACGHLVCWPEGSLSGLSCFRTSAELLEHWKRIHSDDKDTEKPFRCGLPDCGRSWKNLNGLQYHLQISAAHFEAALTGRFFSDQRNSSPECQEMPLEPSGIDKLERTFTCATCAKSYRHSSGLRYHMKHGHQKRQPHQLLNVPPTVERASIRLRRMYTGSTEKIG